MGRPSPTPIHQLAPLCKTSSPQHLPLPTLISLSWMRCYNAASCKPSTELVTMAGRTFARPFIRLGSSGSHSSISATYRNGIVVFNNAYSKCQFLLQDHTVYPRVENAHPLLALFDGGGPGFARLSFFLFCPCDTQDGFRACNFMTALTADL